MSAKEVAALLRDPSFGAALWAGDRGLLDLVAAELKGAVTKLALEEARDRFASRLRSADQAEVVHRPEYREANGCLCVVYMKENRYGELEEWLEALANFTAQITEEVTLCSGDGESRLVFRIEGRLEDGMQLRPIDVPAAEFLEMKWPGLRWGAAAVPRVGEKGQQLREAIQRHSKPTQRTAAEHLGWRKSDGSFLYVHAGGVIGPGQLDAQLGVPLNRFVLPDKTEQLKTAVSSSVELLRSGPMEVVGPLFASVFLGPLSSVLEVDFSVYFRGPSGEMKSVLSAIAQSYWGNFSHSSLPLNWEGTANALERVLYLAKDALVVIDDFAPKASGRAHDELQRTAERVLRSVGNRSGRARMNRRLEGAPEYYPRGLLLTSGEDLPLGGSILARLVVVEVRKAKLDLKRITKLQAETKMLQQSMRGYIEWLMPQMPRLEEGLMPLFHELRAEAIAFGHARAAGNFSKLLLGAQAGLSFATEVGALTEQEADFLMKEIHGGLRSVASRQAESQHEAHPTVVFIRTLRQLFIQERAALFSPRDSLAARVIPAVGDGAKIGWIDDQYVYLDPGAARGEVIKALREAGETFSWSRGSLNDALVHEGWVIPEKDGHVEHKLRVSEGRVRVLRLPRNRFFEEEFGPSNGVSGAGTGAADSAANSTGCAGSAPVAPEEMGNTTHIGSAECGSPARSSGSYADPHVRPVSGGVKT